MNKDEVSNRRGRKACKVTVQMKTTYDVNNV